MINTLIEYPHGPVALNSSLYIRRPPLERQGCQEISQPGAVIRIRAPKKMGKSSLMLRIVNEAEKLGYHIATIDFQRFDSSFLKNLDRFLRSFCLQVTKQLKLEPDLDEYWDENIGSKVSCSLYFRWHILENIDRPLVLVLNEVNELFEYSQLTQDFLPLLRSWYEEGKQIETWQKIRLIIVYSTDVYVPLKITQSPFNIGLPLTLSEFTVEQVEQLAHLHNLAWKREQTEQLMAMVGGHPLLVRLAFYHLSVSEDETLENLLKSATSDRGIYQEHLQRIYQTLEQAPDLKIAFKEFLNNHTTLGLQSISAYKLESLGLVKLNGNQLQVRYELYRRYFFQKFELESQEDPLLVFPVSRIVELEAENQKLKQLFNLDPVTQVGNRQYFDRQFSAAWELLSDSKSPLSLMIGEVDFYKIYSDYYGLPSGESCLQQIAQVFREVIPSEDMLVFRYGEAKFSLILPKIDTREAIKIGSKILKNVEALNIAINIPNYIFFPEKFVTVSLGVATTMPQANNSNNDLLMATEFALKTSKNKGGNCLSPRLI
jgi:diguanylate cyclase (GGDEF)-like protein